MDGGQGRTDYPQALGAGLADQIEMPGYELVGGDGDDGVGSARTVGAEADVVDAREDDDGADTRLVEYIGAESALSTVTQPR